MEISHKNTHTAVSSGKIHLLIDYNAWCEKAIEGNQLLRSLIIPNSSYLSFECICFDVTGNTTL
jgi:hypothetical protein